MENAIKIHVPIAVSYTALEEVLREQMLGEYIPKPAQGSSEPPYAQILDIRIAGTTTGIYDINLRIKLRILRTVLKRDAVDLIVMASLGYDNAAQLLFVRKFKVDSRTSSGLYNTSLEVLANRVAYNQILQKTRIDLREIILKGIKKVNDSLTSGLELKGLKLRGAVEEVLVQDISAESDGLSLKLELQGNLQADIFDLISLLPPKPEKS